MAKKDKDKKAKKSKADRVLDKAEAKAKGKKARDTSEDSDDAAFDPYSEFGSVLDEVAHKMSDADTLDDVTPMSTGSLALDLITGGGIRPAMYTNFGPEQSGKTTGALLMMASAIKHNVPIISLRDFEGSTGNSIPYVTSILKTCGIKMDRAQLFGKKNDTTGKWEIQPRVRYSANTMGVTFFNWFAAILRRLPDKKMLNGEWWLVYEDTKENQKYNEFADKSMPKRYGKGIYIRAKDGGLQGLVICDSYPNMNPDTKDEDQVDNSLALQARMFSKNLPRVKGYLAPKKVALIGINQLRDVPMAMFGPKEQEPGGKALRYNSDVRLRWYPRALSAIPLWPKAAKKGGKEIEPSVTGEGLDKYKYMHVSAAKNKLSESDREMFIRIWAKDANGQAHGIDPVFDTMQYLRETGQLLGKKRAALQLKWEDNKPGKEMDWQDFKLWILGGKEDMVKMSKKAGMPKPMNLRAMCFKQIAKGTGEKLFTSMQKATDSKSSSSDDDGDDE